MKTVSSKLSEKIASYTKPAVSNLVIIARAGTGKTTTLVESLRVLRGGISSIIPSPQQQAIFNEVCKSDKNSSVAFVAFNKSIAEELKKRIPDGCDAMTMHSMGMKAVTKQFGRLQIPNSPEWVVRERVAKILNKDVKELMKHSFVMLKAVEELVGLVKMNLSGTDEESLMKLVTHYEVDLGGFVGEVMDLVPKVIEVCKNPKEDGRMDFNDMIWLPIIHDLPLFRYDVLLVDEAQDLNKCQQQLALKAGKRLIMCGDPKQAIYGFAGADSSSMDNMIQILGKDVDCVVLPLTVTRRCGKAIVEEARKLVPDFEAHSSNGPGRISKAIYTEDQNGTNYRAGVKDGDFIISRVNSPLVCQCLKFLREGRKANVRGRDIGRGLISQIKKFNSHSIHDLLMKIEEWADKESKKELSKKNPMDSRLIAIQDRKECLLAFAEEAISVESCVSSIESVFSDTCAGIQLSSIHKVKGLEAKRVFFIVATSAGALCPHPMAKSAWQKEQEWNLKYVGITRAIEELIFVE